MKIRKASILFAFIAVSAHAGLIGFYPLNGSASDLSGNGADATTVSNVSFVAGYEGQAGSFNGTSSYIQVPININPAATPMLTMGAWVLPDDVNPIRGIISNDDGGFDRNLNIDNRGGCGSACYSAFTGSGVLAGTAATASPVDWVFAAVSYNAATGAIKLYVDGSNFSATGTPGSGWTYTEIGHNPSFTEWFSGKIDNVFLFDEVLTDTQITGIRSGGASAILAYANTPGVPEPATFGLAAGALLVATFFRRRLAR
jgi:hypothetical protein